MPVNTKRITASARIEDDLSGLRLDQAAAALFPDYSRGRLQIWIRSGDLTVDGRAAKPTYRVNPGERLHLDAEVTLQDGVAAQDIPLDVLFADADLIVLNKPAGLVVHPAAGNPDGTLQNALLHFDGGLAALPRAGIVHRLDKDTSGVMVVARSLRAHSSLVEQLQQRSMSRVYHAVAHGDLLSGGSVDAPIGRHPRHRKKMAVVQSGRPAVSHYRVLRRFGAASYLEVALKTGRTHQIRVHMSHLGHPLVGDPVYGRSPKRNKTLTDAQLEVLRVFPRQALHAKVLKLAHPGTGELRSFEAELPQDFEDLLQVLEGVAHEQ